MRQEHRKNLILTGLSLLSLSIPLQAAKDLVEYSPFLPPGYAEKMKEIQEKKDKKIEKTPPPAPKVKPQLTFKGYFRLGGVWKFSIFDKNTGKTSWVTLDKQTESGLVLSNFDPETGFIKYSYNGQQGELELASPSSTAASSPRQTASNQTNTNSPSIPKRTPNTGSSATPSPSKPTTIAKNLNTSVGGNIPGIMNDTSLSKTNSSPTKTSSAAPSAPPAVPPPSFTPTLPTNLTGIGNTNSTTSTSNNNSLTFNAGNVTPDSTNTTASNTASNVQSNTTPTSAAINNPPSNSVQPTDSSRTITPRRATLNLPPGIPPPPTVAPPSLPEFLNVGGPPPAPGN